MEKIFIKNRKGERMCVEIARNPDQKGLAFIMHGLGGFKEQPHVRTFGEAFREKGFTVVWFDTTNSMGESDGRYEDATTTNYYEDLEDLISWASAQSWYQEPFYLSGHSLGGISTALFAQKYPEKVKGIAPISPVVSGKLTLETEAMLEEWKKTGWRVTESKSKPGLIKRLPWSHIEDRIKYNLLPEAAKLTMPVLLIVGSEDPVTPPKHQQLLFDALPEPKEYHVIEGAPHTFRDPKHLTEIKQLFLKWIDKVEAC